MPENESNTAESLPVLPAPKALGGLAEIRPRIVIDSREQTPLVFRRLPTVTGTLQSGDYSFTGGEELFSVERKSVPDLVACCIGDNRERFERELHRLRGHRFKRLLIVGARADVENRRYRSNVSPKAVLATLSAFEVRYDLPVVWSNNPEDAARTIESWVWWFAREIVQCATNLLNGTKALPNTA